MQTKSQLSENKTCSFTKDITLQFTDACRHLEAGQLVHSPDFTLNRSMAAIEIMDCKMDARAQDLQYIIEGPASSRTRFLNETICASDTTISNTKIPNSPSSSSTTPSQTYCISSGLPMSASDLPAAQQVYVIQRALCSLVSWLQGDLLQQTLLTNMYMHLVQFDTVNQRSSVATRHFSCRPVALVCMALRRVVSLASTALVLPAACFDEEDFYPSQSTATNFYKLPNHITEENDAELPPTYSDSELANELGLLETELANEIAADLVNSTATKATSANTKLPPIQMDRGATLECIRLMTQFVSALLEWLIITQHFLSPRPLVVTRIAELNSLHQICSIDDKDKKDEIIEPAVTSYLTESLAFTRLSAAVRNMMMSSGAARGEQNWEAVNTSSIDPIQCQLNQSHFPPTIPRVSGASLPLKFSTALRYFHLFCGRLHHVVLRLWPASSRFPASCVTPAPYSMTQDGWMSHDAWRPLRRFCQLGHFSRLFNSPIYDNKPSSEKPSGCASLPPLHSQHLLDRIRLYNCCIMSRSLFFLLFFSSHPAVIISKSSDNDQQEAEEQLDRQQQIQQQKAGEQKTEKSAPIALHHVTVANCARLRFLRRSLAALYGGVSHWPIIDEFLFSSSSSASPLLMQQQAQNSPKKRSPNSPTQQTQSANPRKGRRANAKRRKQQQQQQKQKNQPQNSTANQNADEEDGGDAELDEFDAALSTTNNGTHNQAYSHTQTQQKLHMFLVSVSDQVFRLAQELCANRARQHQKAPQQIAAAWSTYEECVKADHLIYLSMAGPIAQHYAKLHQSGAAAAQSAPPPQSAQPHLSLLLALHVLQLQLDFLLAGFQLELYAPHEMPSVYFFLAENLLPFYITQLSNLQVRNAGGGGGGAGVAALQQIAQSLHVQLELSRASLLLLSALQLDGRLCGPPPNYKFTSERIRYAHRFRALLPASCFNTHDNTADNSNSKSESDDTSPTNHRQQTEEDEGGCNWFASSGSFEAFKDYMRVVFETANQTAPPSQQEQPKQDVITHEQLAKYNRLAVIYGNSADYYDRARRLLSNIQSELPEKQQSRQQQQKQEEELELLDSQSEEGEEQWERADWQHGLMQLAKQNMVVARLLASCAKKVVRAGQLDAGHHIDQVRLEFGATRERVFPIAKLIR